MTPAERFDTYAHEAGRLADDWPLWASTIAATLPDGYPAQTGGSGASTGHTEAVTDRTADAALRREHLTVRDGVDIPRQTDLLTGHLLELSLTLAAAAIGHAPTPNAQHTPGLRLAITDLALRTCRDHWRHLTVIEWDSDLIGTRAALDLIDSYLTRLRTIIPPRRHHGPANEPQTCRCPIEGRGTWGRDVCTQLGSARHDGLAPACYQRRWRWKLKLDEVA